MPASPQVPPPGSLGAKLMQAGVNANVALYRLTGGRLGGKVKGAPSLLLDHIGRKSGKVRTTPVLYLQDGPDLVIVASRGGSDATPAWWLNCQANPRTTIQIGAERRQVVAREATADERERFWPRLVELFPDYAVYQSRTDRQLPVIILSPAP
jgi:deazaflavin-dependent oxidoreductase (nitroreductase family)